MKKIFFILVLVAAILFKGNAQNNEVIPSVGLNFGIDYNMNAYQLSDRTYEGYTYSYFGISPRYNIGADFGLKITNRFRPRIEFKYVNLKYGIDYSNTHLNLEVFKTVTNVNYLDLNLHFDYILFTISKFQLFASPAIKYEFQTGYSISTNKWSFLEFEHPSNIAAGAFSAIFKYNLSKRFGITLTPEYTYFFRPFFSKNTEPYQRVSVNLGCEYSFKD